MKTNEAIYKVGTSTRTNLHELGKAGERLLKRGLIQKDWRRNDASGEAVVLTASGVERFKKTFS